MQTNCPECSQSMEAGYVVSISGIHWSPDKNIGKHFVPNMKTDVMFPENEGAFLQNPRFSAQRCRRCELVILRYSE
jgi:hypothetical protein